MLCTGSFVLLMLIGVLCRIRAVFYLIPWVLLIDKVFEYPIQYDLLTDYTNMILAIYSQSALFQIVLFSCNNFVESACIFWVLQVRITTYIYNVNEEEINWRVFIYIGIFFIMFSVMQSSITNSSMMAFVQKKKIETQLEDFKDILEEFPDGIMIFLPLDLASRRYQQLRNKPSVQFEYINK